MTSRLSAVARSVAAYCAGTGGGGLVSSLVNIILLGNFDPKYSHVPTTAFEVELLALPFLTACAGVIFGIVCYIVIGEASNRTTAALVGTAFLGFLLPPLLLSLGELMNALVDPESIVSAWTLWAFVSLYSGLAGVVSGGKKRYN